MASVYASIQSGDLPMAPHLESCTIRFATPAKTSYRRSSEAAAVPSLEVRPSIPASRGGARRGISADGGYRPPNLDPRTRGDGGGRSLSAAGDPVVAFD